MLVINFAEFGLTQQSPHRIYIMAIVRHGGVFGMMKEQWKLAAAATTFDTKLTKNVPLGGKTVGYIYELDTNRATQFALALEDLGHEVGVSQDFADALELTGRMLGHPPPSN